MKGVSGVFEPDWKSPPGDTIKDLMLEKYCSTPAKLAVELGLSLPATKKLLKGTERITPRLAMALSAVLGSTPRFWLTREAQYRQDRAWHKRYTTVRAHKKRNSDPYLLPRGSSLLLDSEHNVYLFRSSERRWNMFTKPDQVEFFSIVHWPGAGAGKAAPKPWQAVGVDLQSTWYDSFQAALKHTREEAIRADALRRLGVKL